MALIAKKLHKGFTIPEVAIALVLTGVLIIPFAIIAVYFLSSMFDRSTESVLTSEAQNTLRTISEELKTAYKILPSATINDPNKAGYWTTNLSGGTLVFNSIAYDTNRQVLINTSTNTPHLNEAVYHRQGNLLFKRSLPANGTPTNFMIRSCPPASAVAPCVADTVLTSNLSSLSFVLYDDNNQVTTDPNLATSVLVKIALSKPSLNSSITVEKDIRITKRKIE